MENCTNQDNLLSSLRVEDNISVELKYKMNQHVSRYKNKHITQINQTGQNSHKQHNTRIRQKNVHKKMYTKQSNCIQNKRNVYTIKEMYTP